jgi:hypothetical protein
MDDATMKAASYTLISNHKPSLLQTLTPPVNEVVYTEHDMRTASDENIKRLMKLKRIDSIAAWKELRCKELEDGASICCSEECSDREAAEDDLVEAARIGKKKREARSGKAVSKEPEMRTATDENIKRLMKETGLDWEEAWTELRCKELEDGQSICCTEECSDRDEAIEELVEAARRGKKKRNARRKAAGRQVSDTEEDEDSSKKPYIAPPKVRDAEINWPFMRCKNVANVLHGGWANKPPIPRNHHGLLEYIAKAAKVSVETLKQTSARELFKDNYLVIKALGKSYGY